MHRFSLSLAILLISLGNLGLLPATARAQVANSDATNATNDESPSAAKSESNAEAVVAEAVVAEATAAPRSETSETNETSAPPDGDAPSNSEVEGEAPSEETPPAEKAEEADADVLAGHSGHGEVFNEGPRQRAYLLEGMGDIDFPATTASEEAQAFINQGVAQLHGFWYFESERSFRQAAALDPDCAIAYWGMAMSNMGNEKRAKGFIAEAMSRKESATDRERKYIEALNAYLEAGRDKRRERAETYTSALEKILYDYPDDIEAKALLALQLWNNRSAGLKIQSHLAVDALLQQIFAEAPLHPAHHFCIHLWDYERPEKALASSAACGPSLPGIAHMWHMPGHIYSRLKRYPDAVWQQEASARVDHAHMMRYGVLPDQIHNFAHNNEWLIRNLIYLGRIGDAIDLAKNMIELPRHPKYNVLTKSGCSASHGRTRLFEVLATFEMWEELIQLADRPYLEPTEIDREQVKRLRYLGVAYLGTGRTEQGEEVLEELRTRLAKEQEARDQAVSKATDEFDEKNPESQETPAEQAEPGEVEPAESPEGESPEGTAQIETTQPKTRQPRTSQLRTRQLRTR
jgi:tetratricopeptide (TPR) repeat protein